MKNQRPEKNDFIVEAPKKLKQFLNYKKEA